MARNMRDEYFPSGGYIIVTVAISVWTDEISSILRGRVERIGPAVGEHPLGLSLGDEVVFDRISATKIDVDRDGPQHVVLASVHWENVVAFRRGSAP